MARTPLYDALRRSLHYARAADIGGVTAAEVVDRAVHERERLRAERDGAHGRQPGTTRSSSRAERDVARDVPAIWSRRGFLGFGAGAATTLALGGCSRALEGFAAADPSEPVLVVGAGIAGLTAAYRLHRANVPVRVFEAQSRTGGRMYSLRGYFAEGQVVELGGELIDTGHAAIRALAAELDVALDDVSVEPADIAHETWYFGGARRSTPEIVDALRPLALRLEADRRGLGGDVTYRSGGTAQRLDRTPLAQWLDEAGVSGWIRSLIDVAYTTEFGLEPGQQSALNLITMLDPDPFRIFGESDERFRAHAGNDLITTRLAERLDGRIETETVLESVRAAGGRRYTVTLRRDGSVIEATSPHVIIAVPFTMLRRVELRIPMRAEQRRAIDELDYGTNAKLMIGFADRTWRTAHRASGSTFTDLPYQTTWETSRGQAGRAGVLTNFTGGRNGAQLIAGTPADQAQRTVDGLERIFPGIAAQRAGMREARFHWPTHPWTQGSYACFSPGQWTAYRGIIGEPAGGVHFIGEHASLDAQGFMEGGCETGEAAAAAVLGERGVPVGSRNVTRRALLAGR